MTSLDTHAPAHYSVGQAIGLVFRTAITHWRTCVSISAAYALLLGATNAIARSSTGVVDPGTLQASDVSEASIEALIAIGVFFVINVFVGPVTLGALSLVGSAAVYSDEIDAKGIVRRALDRASDAVATALVLGLTLVLPVVLVGLISLLLMIAAWFVGFFVLVFGSIVIGLPVLYMFVRLSLAVPVVMREGRSPIAALRRSWALVGGAWWKVFGVEVVISLFIWIAIFIVSVQSFFGRDTAMDFAIGVVLTTIATVVVVTLYGLASGVVYAMRAPEDTLPPDVAASEARVDADASRDDRSPAE